MKYPKFWIYIIAAIVAAMIVACLCSCEPTRQTRTIENVSGTCAGYKGYMAHKGNCKYCEQRHKR